MAQKKSNDNRGRSKDRVGGPITFLAKNVRTFFTEVRCWSPSKIKPSEFFERLNFDRSKTLEGLKKIEALSRATPLYKNY